MVFDMKNLLKKLENFIKKHFLVMTIVAFAFVPMNFFFLSKDGLRNVFALVSAVTFCGAFVRTLEWKFGDAFFIKDTFSRMPKNKNKSPEEMKEIYISSAAESFALGIITFILALILYIVLLFI